MSATATQPAKETGLTMNERERLDLSKDAGRDLSVKQAHLYRIRKIQSQAVEHMLEGRSGK